MNDLLANIIDPFTGEFVPIKPHLYGIPGNHQPVQSPTVDFPQLGNGTNNMSNAILGEQIARDGGI